MKKYIKNGIVLILLLFLFCMNSTEAYAENYERDYMKKIFNSENGLEGTAANCILSSEEGFVWIGGYTGLYRYDGSEFQNYLINGKAIPVNDIIQDGDGNIWVGTNGEGVYQYNGNQFYACEIDSEESGSSTVNKLCLDSSGNVWVGTKSGLFFVDKSSDSKKAYKKDELYHLNIEEISEIAPGQIVVIEKGGNVYLIRESGIMELDFPQLREGNIPRCCGVASEDSFYIGTTGNQILKAAVTGEVINLIEIEDLECFNQFYEYKEGEFWVCSDTGIGILKEEIVTKINFPLKDSVEAVCEDYQGNFWFVSSRQGVLQIYENNFSDLGSYLGIEQTVNAIILYKSRLYVGCDNGLYCFKDKTKVHDELVAACNGKRIRQLYVDQENNLWVSTYQDGIKKMDKTGQVTSFNMYNSNLTTNQIRCVFQKQNKEILIGTEEGLFIMYSDETIHHVTSDEDLNTKRILDVKEAKDGKIYAATDGYGVYVIENDDVKMVYSKLQGLGSNIIMKIVPSDRFDGIWVVTGAGINFIDVKGNVKKIDQLPIANTLDMLFFDDGEAAILAGNGLFMVKEEELFKNEEILYKHFDRQNGLPIDFTANSWSIKQNGSLYMCGTTGITSLDMDKENKQKPIRLYINTIKEDGEEVENTGEKIFISSKAYRLTMDVRLINYLYQDLAISYFLEGVDKKATVINNADKTEISYTNLKGGEYTYHLKVIDTNTQECLAELDFPIEKKYSFWEEPTTKSLVAVLLLAIFALFCILIVMMREKQIRKKYREEKQKEISRLAYKDLVTSVYNRNCFEEDKEKMDMKGLYALALASINHLDYLSNKHGILYMENILRKGVKVLSDCYDESVKIYRISDNIFCICFMKPIHLETYVKNIKDSFEKEGKEIDELLSFAVGAVYNNRIEMDNIDELIKRCDQMRLLDEKHAEAKFIEGKMKML